jgi:hypothetical protein
MDKTSLSLGRGVHLLLYFQVLMISGIIVYLTPASTIGKAIGVYTLLGHADWSMIG